MSDRWNQRESARFHLGRFGIGSTETHEANLGRITILQLLSTCTPGMYSIVSANDMALSRVGFIRHDDLDPDGSGIRRLTRSRSDRDK